MQSKAASVVWCPSSNLFLLGRTLTPGVLRSGILVALGTDSALTATGDLLDELHAARSASRLSRGDLYRMVTEEAAQVLRLEKGAGRVSEGGPADLVAVRDQGRTPAATLCGLVSRGPEMVMVAGQIKLVSPSLAVQLPAFVHRRLYPLAVEGRGKTLVDADVPELHRRATRVLGPEILVAGKAGAGMNSSRQNYWIEKLPILILFPHSRCNCRCIMCDIWKIETVREIAAAELGGC